MCPIRIEYETYWCKGLWHLCDLHIVTGLGSRVVPICLCADCKSRISSSMVLNIMPRLPWLPALKGKFIKPFYSLFRSPDRLDRVTAFKVSPSAPFRSFNVSRSRFDTATSTDESNDSVSTFWMVTGWLHESGALQVSLSVFLCRFVVQTLDLELYRSDFDSAAVTPGSVDLPVTFQVVSGWLCYAGAYPVSFPVFWRLADLYRFRFDSSTSTPRSIGLQATLWRVYEWLCRSGMSMVSRFTFLSWIDTDVLDFELYRSDLDGIASMPESNDSIGMFEVD